MDIFLIDNCQNLINEVQNAVNSYGVYDVEIDPGYCVFGACSQQYFENWIKENKTELEKAWEFAVTWDINENEFVFDNEEKKALFIISYLAGYMEPENENEFAA